MYIFLRTRRLSPILKWRYNKQMPLRKVMTNLDSIFKSRDITLSFCPQSLPASGSFPMSHLFAWGGQIVQHSLYQCVVWDILSKRHWDTQEECRLLGPILALLNQSLWGWGSGICILNMFPWNMSCIIKHTMHTLLCKPQSGLVNKHSKLFF